MTDDGAPTRKASRFVAVITRALLGIGFALVASGLGALAGRLAKQVKSAPALDAPLTMAAAGLRYDWRLKLGRHWQITSSPSESQETTDAAEGTRGACAEPGMVDVKGQMEIDASANAFYDHNSVEELQKTTCTASINRNFPERCSQFDRARWLTVSKELPTRSLHFSSTALSTQIKRANMSSIGVAGTKPSTYVPTRANDCVPRTSDFRL